MVQIQFNNQTFEVQEELAEMINNLYGLYMMNLELKMAVRKNDGDGVIAAIQKIDNYIKPEALEQMERQQQVQEVQEAPETQEETPT